MNVNAKPFQSMFMSNLYKDVILAPKILRPVAKDSSLQKNQRNTFVGLPLLTNGNLSEHYKNSLELWKKDGLYEYAKSDALTRLNSKKIQIDDVILEQITNEPSISAASPNPSGAPLPTTPSNELEDNFMWAKFDFACNIGYSNNVSQSIDYLASRYATMEAQIYSEYEGEQRTAGLNRLDAIINQYKNQLAQDFSDQMSEFFKENGTPGKGELLYQTVLDEVEKKTAQYQAYIKDHSEYAEIDGPNEVWLKNDSAYMASELRKAMATTQTDSVENGRNSNGYTAEELGKIQAFATELKSYSQVGSNTTKAIVTGSESEESLGLKLAELKLKGTVFNQYAGVSNELKNMVTKSIENFIADSIKKEQAYMDKWSQLQMEATNKGVAKGDYTKEQGKEQIAVTRKGFQAVNQNAIHAIIDRVSEAYEQTGTVSRALMEGAVFAKSNYMQKVQDIQYTGIYRYDDGDTYWNNFFVNQEKGVQNSYLQKQSGLECVTEAWNGFMEKITAKSGAFLKQFSFSASA